MTKSKIVARPLAFSSHICVHIGQASLLGAERKLALFVSTKCPGGLILKCYDYNDWEGVRFVLGETGASDGAFIVRIAGSNVPGARTYWQWRSGPELTDMNFFDALRDNYSEPEA